MKPLQSIALGLVFLILESRIAGFDLYADPVGWLLVLYGVRGLGPMPRGDLLRGTALLAAFVSVPLWVPAVDRALADADPALGWAADLPRFAFWLALCLSLAEAATAGGEPRSGAWWRVVLLGAVAVVVLPVLVFGAGLTALEGAAGAAVALVPLTMVVLCFSHASRAWARGAIGESAADPPASS